ncbi:MAG: S-layer homology domain-containing protein [Clostridiaceae bacterium]|nr:S-layer homology domain-containing protein [Clostridiaceae bacterium]
MKKRRIAALLACVLLLSLVSVPVSAVDESQQYLFSLTAGVGEGTEPSDKLYANPGDILTIYFTLTRSDIAEGSYPVFAVQEEVEFSDSLFEIETYPVFSDDCEIAFQYGERGVNAQGNIRILMNYVSAALEGDLCPRELAVGSFTLRVKEGASGTAQITSKDYLMSNQDGTDTYRCSANDLTVTFGDDPSIPKTYEIRLLNPLGGTVSTSPSGTATAGSTISLTATPQSGYHFGEWKVTAGSAVVPVTNKASATGASFVMPESGVAVTATFDKNSTPPEGGGSTETPGNTEVTTTPRFIDVGKTHWAYTYVESMAAAGFVNGKTKDMFFPEDSITRAEFVTILARMCGEQLTDGYSGPFTDVNPQQYYASAVAWAARAGVTTGTSETTFSPFRQITRQEIAAMIARYAQYMHYSLNPQNEAREFSDNTDIAAYAAPAIRQMQQADIINGYEDGTFRPRRNASRAEAVKMLAILYQSVQ